MYYLDSCKLDTNIAVHLIGNKTNGDKLILSDSLTKVNKEVMQYLQQYFLTDFKSPELFTLHHDTSLQLNEVYCYITEIFQNKSSLHSQSLNIARHLYNNSTHQNIKKGEFYVVYITGCFINGIETDAIGLFKSENKDVFIEIEQTSKKFEIWPLLNAKGNPDGSPSHIPSLRNHRLGRFFYGLKSAFRLAFLLDARIETVIRADLVFL